AEGSHQSTARIARFGGCYSREGPSLGLGAVITGVASCFTGTNWGTIGAVRPSIGTGIGTGTASGIGVGTTSGTSTGTASDTGVGTASGTGHTG
ncbi:hypothetical protein KI387_005908, partial [Taxus chinensis]